jgi:hypothetical protein
MVVTHGVQPGRKDGGHSWSPAWAVVAVKHVEEEGPPGDEATPRDMNGLARP